MTDLDLLLENARVVDGTGAPWFRGAVGVRDGAIDRVVRGETDDFDAETRVDADGDVVCPGFVDTHSHADITLFEDPLLEPKTRQGITTELVGPDGFSMAPMYREGGAAEWCGHLRGLVGDADADWAWGSVAEYLDAVDEHGPASNVATFVGHGTVRFNVMGMADRAPTEEELEEMADLVTEGLEDGALGFSTGLVYSPHTVATTEEVRTLAERCAPFGRPFRAHIRSEGRRIWEALDEFVDVGADADVPIHLDHYKLAGADQQGKADRSNALIEAARERGIDFTVEQYPYTAGNTLLSAVLPPWVHAEGPEQVLDYLRDDETRERIKRDIEGWRIDGWENQGARTGWENIVVTNIDSEEFAAYEGDSVADVADARDQHPIDAVCDMLIADELGVSMILHAMAEPDVRDFLANERVNVCTDSLFGGKPHPRTYGTYPRVLGKYVREENLLTLEEAVRKMTSLPARAMGLDRKGILRPGMDADLVRFDPAIVESHATFENPRRFPTGLPDVLVNGEFVVRRGELTGARPGEVIRA
jgi:N-acyl-D-amino-acid deacylase